MLNKQINKTPATLKKTIKSQEDEIDRLKSQLAINTTAFLYVADNSLDGIMIIDQQNRVVYTNDAAMHLFNSNLSELMGKPIALDINAKQLSTQSDIRTPVYIPNSLGRHLISEITVLKTEWNNEPCYLLRFHDISAGKKMTEMRDHFSTHDFLTDLPNRYYFEQQVAQSIQYAHENKQQLALIYLNLDNFKIINNTLGHALGDLLLQKISGLLKTNIQSGDIIARLSSDEFALVLKSLTNPEAVAAIAQSILDQLLKILGLEGREEYISASMGISIYPLNGNDTMGLIKNAELAMLFSKTHGKNQYHFFSTDLNQKNEQTLKIIHGLRYALANNELMLHYQPIIDLKALTCSGFEALVRWNHPTLGLIGPEEFLPYAEEMGAMTSIGRWVIQQALDDYKKLNLKSLLFLSINMSANEFLSTTTEDYILSSMKDRAISTRNLVVELTEGAIIRHPEATIKKFKRLSQMGIQIAVDDYGMGYSSLSLLKRLPIAIMKIDKSFIEDLNKDINDAIIVKSSIQLAHNLGLKVIAEGVETAEQVEFLKQHGCDFAQGYYFTQALNFDQLSAYIQAKF